MKFVDIAQVISAIAATAAAIVAAYTAYQSREAAKTIQKDTERRRRPRVGAYLTPSPKSSSIANLVIRNYGGSVALDVKFDIKTDVKIEQASKQHISDYLVFKKGLKAIYPDQTKEQLLMYLYGRDEKFFSTPIEIDVSYRSDATLQGGKLYKETLYLDFLNLPEIASSQRDINDVVRELEKMRRELEQIRRKK